jgi:hypothetical protein
MAKKKAKKKLKSGMVFHTMTLNEQDLRYLRWVLVDHAEDQRHFMNAPPTKGQTPEEMLEDWVIARDFMVDALKIVQMIDKVCPKLAQEVSDACNE